MAKHYTFGWKTANRVKGKTGGKCFYCECELPEDTKQYDERENMVSFTRNWHIDHMIPLSRGGSHDIDNLAPSCGSCNMKKLTMTSDEFIALRVK